MKRFVSLSGSLWAGLIIYTLVPMGLLTAGGAWWGLRTFERQVEQQMRRDLELVAGAIERPLSHALLREREGGVAEALKAAFEMSEVYGAYLYDADGRPLSEPLTDDGGMRREQATRHAAAGRTHGEFGRAGGRDVYSHFVPLTDAGGQITGLLQLTRERSEFSRNIRALRIRGAGLFFSAFLALSLMVVAGHHRAFGRHMQALSESMTEVANGNRSHRHDPGGANEFDSLGSHFNQMLDTLEAAEEEIETRRSSEKELQQRLVHAEKLAALGALAAGVAHELGTPLSAVDARAQRALRCPDLTPETSAALHAIRDESARMGHIIRQLLDFGRRNPAQPRLVDCVELAHRAVAAVEVEAEPNQTKFRVESPEQPVRTAADPVRIEQALVNLLRNALQANPGGEIGLSVRLSQNEVCFRVTDQGPGVSAEAIPKLFEPFFTTKAVGEGTGLGLSVVHGIAGEHGGRVRLMPSQAKGACFEFSIPLKTEGAL